MAPVLGALTIRRPACYLFKTPTKPTDFRRSPMAYVLLGILLAFWLNYVFKEPSGPNRRY